MISKENIFSLNDQFSFQEKKRKKRINRPTQDECVWQRQGSVTSLKTPEISVSQVILASEVVIQ